MTVQDVIDLAAAIGLLSGSCAAALWVFGQLLRAIRD